MQTPALLKQAISWPERPGSGPDDYRPARDVLTLSLLDGSDLTVTATSEVLALASELPPLEPVLVETIIECPYYNGRAARLLAVRLKTLNGQSAVAKDELLSEREVIAQLRDYTKRIQAT